MAKFFGSMSKDIGIDLGTANTLLFVRDKGIVINEPSVVAINNRTGQILAVGHEAREMMGKTPGYISTSRPLNKGIISDFEVAEKMLKYFIEKIQSNASIFSPRPRVVVGVPLDVTEVERKAVEDAVLSAGARDAILVEQPITAAIGARLPVTESVGTMIVDVGGGTTEIAVISLSGVVNWKSLSIAGDELNKNIVQYAREHFNLMLGERVAENIKIRIGSAAPMTEPMTIEMRGRDMMTGLPREVTVTDEQIREALSRSVRNIIENVKSTLELTPPELVADIYERGIILAGGGALLRGLPAAISEAAHIPVRVADDPLTCVARGTGLLLEDEQLLQSIALPSARAN